MSEVTEEVYTKAARDADIAKAESFKSDALTLLAAGKMPGFNSLNQIEAQCNKLIQTARARYNENARLFGALRAAKNRLALASSAEDIARESKKVRYLKLLVSKVLAGEPRPLKLGAVEAEQMDTRDDTVHVRGNQQSGYEVKLPTGWSPCSTDYVFRQKSIWFH